MKRAGTHAGARGSRLTSSPYIGGVQVRRGTSRDFAVVRALMETVAAEAMWIGSEAPVRWTPERREAWTTRADDETAGALFVAEKGEELLGYLMLTRDPFGHAELSMALAPDARGQGIGGRLLDAAVDWCRERSLIKLDCQVWPHNGAALALYRSRGFAVEGRQRRHWRRRNGQLWDGILMGLVLDETSPGSPLPDADLAG